MTTTYQISGTTNEVTVCDCCGKKNLRDTVILEVVEGVNAGDVLNFGSHCAARALGQSKGKAALIVKKAKERQSVEPVVAAVRAAIFGGIEAAKDAGKIAAKDMRVNGCEVSVSGFESWGLVNVDWNGGRVQIPAAQGDVT